MIDGAAPTVIRVDSGHVAARQQIITAAAAAAARAGPGRAGPVRTSSYKFRQVSLRPAAKQERTRKSW